jgi:hypothetical protein
MFCVLVIVASFSGQILVPEMLQHGFTLTRFWQFFVGIACYYVQMEPIFKGNSIGSIGSNYTEKNFSAQASSLHNNSVDSGWVDLPNVYYKDSGSTSSTILHVYCSSNCVARHDAPNSCSLNCALDWGSFLYDLFGSLAGYRFLQIFDG